MNWTAKALDLYNEPGAEDAARYASELIEIYATTDDTELDRAAHEIAEETSISFPWVGANDTASREAIRAALNHARSHR